MIAGLGLAHIYLGMITISITMGLNSALDTYIPQCIGQGNLYLAGVYLNRARIILFIILIPISVVLLFSGPIFEAVGMQPE